MPGTTDTPGGGVRRGILRQKHPCEEGTIKVNTHMRIPFYSFSSLLLGIFSSGYAEEKRVNFAREVLPILSDKCFVCHGPDTRKKTGLRLDSHEAATLDRKGVRAIHPEAPEKK